MMNDEADFQDCARRLKALADPERLRIVSALFAGPMSVSALAERLGDDIVKVSHHLGVLRNAALVESRRDGRFVVYQLHPNVSSKPQQAPTQIDLGCCRLDLA